MRLISLLLTLSLWGCASAADWSNAPTPKLCQQLAKEEPHETYGHMSKNYYAIVDELNRRGEDCGEYIKREMNRTRIDNSTTVEVKN